MKHLATLAVAVMVLAGCEGDTGPMGPAGDQGLQGHPGPGSRTVYSRTRAIPEQPNPFKVSVPEIRLDDMPSVSVYAWDENLGLTEVPAFAVYGIAQDSVYLVTYFINEGEVELWNFFRFGYKIVIVE